MFICLQIRHVGRVAARLLIANGKYPIMSEHLGDTSKAQQAYIASRMAGVGYVRYYEFWSPQRDYVEAALNQTQCLLRCRSTANS